MRHRIIIAACLLLAHASTESAVLAQTSPATETGAESSSTARNLARDLKTLVGAGELEKALRTAQAALKQHPGNEGVKREFLALHMSVARSFLAEESFSAAERALAAVLKVEPAHVDARRLSSAIEAARKAVPAQLESARRWIKLEWFEPAFNSLRQASALLPDEKHAWARAYREAALGAADDHYFCKNFHESFYFYDAAMHLGDTLEIRASQALVARWLQSMVHALARDIEVADYPPAYWKLVLQRAGKHAYDGPGKSVFRSVLKGLAAENLGAEDAAARAYASVSGGSHGDLRESRQRALLAIRRFYDVTLSDRRKGIWLNHDDGDWQVVQTTRFQIHHRNPMVASQARRALEFHFSRIADQLALDLDEVPWQKRCVVYLHADDQAFHTATGQPPQVRAISEIRRRGSSLESHAIHAHQADPLLLAASLNHELAHLVIGSVTRYRVMPGAISEGLALHMEPKCRQLQFARLFAFQGSPQSLAALLKTDKWHPPEPDFYAAAYRLLEVLRQNGDMSGALRMDRKRLTLSELADRFGFASPAELERAYRGGK